MTVQEIVNEANKLIEQGKSIDLFRNIYKQLVLKVFTGDKWTGGEWHTVAETDYEAFPGKVPLRPYKCNRRFVLTINNTIGLTSCQGPCVVDIRPGEFIDFTKICDKKGPARYL